MTEERKKLGFEILLSNFGKSFGYMVLTNLIFAVPLAVSAVVAYLFYSFVLPVAHMALPLCFLLSSPFYAGVVVLSREYSRGIRPKNILKTYLKAVKDNWLQYLLGGLILYVAYVGCYFSLTIYSSLAKSHWAFYILLFVAILITVFFLFLFYALFLMLASFKLRFKDALKNSALMTFGEFKNNFFSTIGVAAFLAVALMPVIVILHLASVVGVNIIKMLLIIYIAVAFGALIPAPCAMIVSNYLYPNMLSVIAGEGVNVENSSSSSSEPNNADVMQVSDSLPETVPAISIEELSGGDMEEYIFYEGKMIKRKKLLSILEQKEENNE